MHAYMLPHFFLLASLCPPVYFSSVVRTFYLPCKDHTLVWCDLIWWKTYPSFVGYLGGRNSSLGESEGRGSILDVSLSRGNMSLISPSLEDGVISWVLEMEITSKSLPLTGLLAPSFLAEELKNSQGNTMAQARKHHIN